MNPKRSGRGQNAVLFLIVFALQSAVHAQEPPSLLHAQALAQEGRWAEAGAELEKIAAAEPDNGAAVFALGFARYSLRQWQAALDAWGKAAELDHRKADALYSMACVLSLAGRLDEAVQILSEALGAGFDDRFQIAEDPDLDNLREHPGFRALFTPPAPFEPHPDAIQVEMTTPSGGRVFGELYLAAASSPATPVVLLLHQAGSNSAEYLPIAPRLTAAGFHALAIDSRGGGRRFGRDNLTVNRLGRPGGYSEAVEDVLTAVGWLRSRAYGGPLVVWGSSYSATNVLRLLVEAPGVFTAGLAFSPGQALDDSGEAYAPRVRKPLLLTWPEHEWDRDREALFAAVGSGQKHLVRQQGGRHGSSTLFPDLNPRAEEVWAEVLAFLGRHGSSTERVPAVD